MKFTHGFSTDVARQDAITLTVNRAIADGLLPKGAQAGVDYNTQITQTEEQKTLNEYSVVLRTKEVE